MNSSNEDIGQIVAVAVQTVGAAIACLLLAGWAWSLAAGSVAGFVLLFLVGALFLSPVVAWGLPAIALVAGLLTQGVVTLIRWRRSRA